MFSLALAAVIGLIAVSLFSGAAAGDSGAANGAPNSLTHHFPLGTQTLSRSKTAAASGAATTPRQAAGTAPHGGSSARSQTSRPRAGHSGSSVSPILFALASPIVIVAALLGRAALRRSRRAVRSHAGVRLRPARSIRPTAHARWAYQDDVERAAPPLPVRRRRE